MKMLEFSKKNQVITNTITRAIKVAGARLNMQGTPQPAIIPSGSVGMNAGRNARRPLHGGVAKHPGAAARSRML